MIIRKLRQDRGWSQEDLAAISGVSARTIQRIENGGRASLETLKCLAAVFETTIPDLQQEQVMTDTEKHTPPVELQEPLSQPPESAGLSEEDRAALRYVRYLRKYDDGWDDDFAPVQDFPEDERKLRKQVREERAFYGHLFSFLAIMLFLLVLNLLTSPGYLWVVWPALGWGIGLAFHAYDTFGRGAMMGDDWERRQVERRLQKLRRD